MSDRVKVSMFLLVISIAFCWGIFGDLYGIGVGDWDQHLFYHGSSRKIITDFGQFPLWNPFYCGGNPMLANPQSPFLSPFFIFVLVFGTVVGLKLSIIAHLFTGLIGMYALSRELGMKGAAALLPGFIFMLSGVFVLHMAEGHTTWLPMAYIPFVFLFFKRATRSPVNLLAASAFLALMLFEGGTLLVVYTVLFLVLYAILEAITSKEARPILILVATGVCFALFSSIKLLPMLDLISEFPRLVTDTNSMGARVLFYALLGFDQTHDFSIAGMREGWWEYSAYVGPLALLLYIISFRRLKKDIPLRATGLIFLLISLGSNNYIDLWGWLHGLPVFSQQRVSPRYLIYFVFSLSLLAGLELTRIEERHRERGRGAAIPLAVTVIVLLNMFLVMSPVLSDVFRYELPDAGEGTEFSQHILNRETYSYGPSSAMYPALLRGDGVKNCYEEVRVGRNIIAKEEAGYSGEFYMLSSMDKGGVELKRWSPQKIEFRVGLATDDLLIVNQNFHKGWKSDLPLKNHEGLLAIEVSPDAKEVKLYYCPNGFKWGLLITVISTALALVWFFMALGGRRRRF